MSYLTVGIHENLVLDPKTKINDKGSLELHIKSNDGGNEEDSMFNAFNAGSTSALDGMEGKIIFFPPNMKTFDGNVKTAPEIAKDLLVVAHQLKQYASLYATKDEVETALGGFAMFDGIVDTTNTALMKQTLPRLTDEEFMHSVLKNLCGRFIMFIESKNGFEEPVPFRQKFIRQSANKHYPTISKSDFDVWLESMEIPKEASKVSWSEWEIKNKKNDPTPIAAAASDDEEEEVNMAAEDMFASEADDSAPDLFNQG